MTINTMQKQILQKLYIHNYIGGKHTSEENAQKWFPKNHRGQAKNEVKQLIKKGYLLFHPTSYEIQISINPTKIPEIKKLLNQ